MVLQRTRWTTGVAALCRARHASPRTIPVAHARTEGDAAPAGTHCARRPVEGSAPLPGGSVSERGWGVGGWSKERRSRGLSRVERTAKSIPSLDLSDLRWARSCLVCYTNGRSTNLLINFSSDVRHEAVQGPRPSCGRVVRSPTRPRPSPPPWAPSSHLGSSSSSGPSVRGSYALRPVNKNKVRKVTHQYSERVCLHIYLPLATTITNLLIFS